MRRLQRLVRLRYSLVLATAICAVLMVLTRIGAFDTMDARLADMQLSLLRMVAMESSDADIVVIAIDEATLRRTSEPLSLWHPHYGYLFRRLARAAPRAVGLNVVLPERSYEERYPNTDRAILQGLQSLRNAKVPVVLTHSIREDRRPRPVYAPYLALVDPVYGVGIDVLRPDSDGIVRRHTEILGEKGESIPTFAGQLIRAAGFAYRPGRLNSRINHPLTVISASDLLFGDVDGVALRAIVDDKLVIIGGVFADSDHYQQPVQLFRDIPKAAVPGLLLQARFAAQLQDATLLQPAPRLITLGLIAASVLLWPLATNVVRATKVCLYWSLLILFLSMMAMYHGATISVVSALVSGAFFSMIPPAIRYRRARLAFQQEQARVAARDTFVTAISHDLRTPAASIASTVELLDKVQEPEQQARYLGWLKQSAWLLTQEIEQLLDLSPSRGTVANTGATTVNLYDLLVNIYQGLLPIATVRQLSLTLSISAVIHPIRQIPLAALTRLLQNLISNALKYTSSGDVRLRVYPGCKDGYIRFEVKDDGDGVPQSVVEHLSSSPQECSLETRGYGLGLQIVRQLASSLGGEVGIHTRVGNGTTVWAELPLTSVERVPVPDSDCIIVHRSCKADVSGWLSGLHTVATTPQSGCYIDLVESDTERTDDAPRAIRVQMHATASPVWKEAVWVMGQGAVISDPPTLEVIRRLLYLATLDCRLNGELPCADDNALASSEQPKGSILLIDDDPLVRLVLSELLSVAGHSVITAGSGNEAIEHCIDPSIGLVILDQQLSNELGTDLIPLLRRKMVRETPIVVLTAEAVSSQAQPTAGVAQVLSKTIPPDALLAQIGEYLGSNNTSPHS